MTEPMTDERLAEIRGYLADDEDEYVHYQRPIVVELLNEVDRLRALEVPTGFVELATEPADPEQVAAWQAAWDETMTLRGAVSYDLPSPPDPNAPLWQPFRDQPRTRDYPAGG